MVQLRWHNYHRGIVITQSKERVCADVPAVRDLFFEGREELCLSHLEWIIPLFETRIHLRNKDTFQVASRWIPPITRGLCGVTVFGVAWNIKLSRVICVAVNRVRAGVGGFVS